MDGWIDRQTDVDRSINLIFQVHAAGVVLLCVLTFENRWMWRQQDPKVPTLYTITHSLTHSLTPWSRVLHEKLTGPQLVKKFSSFYGTRRLITAFTTARHKSLSWARSIQSMLPHPTSFVILSSHLHLGLPNGSFPRVSPPKSYMQRSSPPYEKDTSVSDTLWGGKTKKTT